MASTCLRTSSIWGCCVMVIPSNCSLLLLKRVWHAPVRQHVIDDYVLTSLVHRHKVAAVRVLLHFLIRLSAMRGRGAVFPMLLAFVMRGAARPSCLHLTCSRCILSIVNVCSWHNSRQGMLRAWSCWVLCQQHAR